MKLFEKEEIEGIDYDYSITIKENNIEHTYDNIKTITEVNEIISPFKENTTIYAKQNGINVMSLNIPLRPAEIKITKRYIEHSLFYKIKRFFKNI